MHIKNKEKQIYIIITLLQINNNKQIPIIIIIFISFNCFDIIQEKKADCSIFIIKIMK